MKEYIYTYTIGSVGKLAKEGWTVHTVLPNNDPNAQSLRVFLMERDVPYYAPGSVIHIDNKPHTIIP